MSDVEDRIKKIRYYKECFISEAGQEVLQDLVKSCGIFHSSFSADPYENAFMSGQREIVLRILNVLKVDIGAYQSSMSKITAKEKLNEYLKI